MGFVFLFEDYTSAIPHLLQQIPSYLSFATCAYDSNIDSIDKLSVVVNCNHCLTSFFVYSCVLFWLVCSFSIENDDTMA